MEYLWMDGKADERRNKRERERERRRENTQFIYEYLHNVPLIAAEVLYGCPQNLCNIIRTCDIIRATG